MTTLISKLFNVLTEIPEPQRCLMRSENLTKYVICKQEHEDGCQPTGI